MLKYELHHDVDGALGTLYMDLLARPGKYAGAAHMVIRCGRAVHDFERNDGRFYRAGDAVGSGSAASGSAYQLPAVALLASFPWPTASIAHVRLVPQQVETLFHEFGHALHSLLSRTEFQNLSGERHVTRGRGERRKFRRGGAPIEEQDNVLDVVGVA